MESLYKDRDVRRFIRAGGFFAVCMIITGAFLYYVHMEDIKSLYLQQQAEAAGALLQAGIEPVEAARILGGERAFVHTTDSSFEKNRAPLGAVFSYFRRSYKFKFRRNYLPASGRTAQEAL